MPLIEIETQVAAPIEIVFDLARSIDLHTESTSRSAEVAVDGVTSGLIGLGDHVTFEATHFGVRQRLTAQLIVFDRPNHFRDTMIAGAFKRFDHDHFFQTIGEGTVMVDRFDYTSPLRSFGKLADAIFLKRYMSRLLRDRADTIRQVAETGQSDSYLK